jgi:hypothetical protein
MIPILFAWCSLLYKDLEPLCTDMHSNEYTASLSDEKWACATDIICGLIFPGTRATVRWDRRNGASPPLTTCQVSRGVPHRRPLDFHTPCTRGHNAVPDIPLTLTNSSHRGPPRPLIRWSNYSSVLPRVSQGGAHFQGTANRPHPSATPAHPVPPFPHGPRGPLAEAKLK